MTKHVDEDKRWKQLQEKAQKIWPELTTSDLQKCEGSPEKLQHLIESRFGEEPKVIQTKLGDAGMGDSAAHSAAIAHERQDDHSQDLAHHVEKHLGVQTKGQHPSVQPLTDRYALGQHDRRPDQSERSDKHNNGGQPNRREQHPRSGS